MAEGQARRGRPRRSDSDEDGIFVKVARTGGEVKEFLLNGERTVEEALKIAEIEYDDDNRIRVNGSEADLETELEDGNVVTISGKVEGGQVV